MKNVLKNIKDGEHHGSNISLSGFSLARHYADLNEKETGLKTIVTRFIDYIDRYNGNDRAHYSFDVVELNS